MFNTGFGNYELLEDSYSDYEHGEIVIQIVIIIAVLLNCILLLNFVIAMLADTYSKLTNQSLGLYYDGVIARIPVYEDDLKYGGLIVGTPPFNLIAIFLLPYYFCVKEEKRLVAVNEAFKKLVFLPIALIMSCLFAAFSLLMVPFAYLQAIRIKLLNMCGKEENAGKKKEKKKDKESKKRSID